MQTNGNTEPAIGPPPWMKGVRAGIFKSGWATKMPIAQQAITPTFI